MTEIKGRGNRAIILSTKSVSSDFRCISCQFLPTAITLDDFFFNKCHSSIFTLEKYGDLSGEKAQKKKKSVKYRKSLWFRGKQNKAWLYLKGLEPPLAHNSHFKPNSLQMSPWSSNQTSKAPLSQATRCLGGCYVFPQA